jgi:hypothetical protein
MSYTNGLDKPSDYFNTKLYTGNASTQSITGLDFAPDFVWLKDRTNANSGRINDIVRTATKYLIPSTTGAEATEAAGLTSFNSDGFSLGSNSDFNGSGANFVSWNWLASNTTASNTDGSITSTVSANTTSGFSIVSWTGSGANATIGHGLGVAPKMIIIRRRTGSTTNWIVYHESIGNNNELYLNTTDASTSSTRFQSTSPTSSVFSVSTNSAVNESSQSIIAYCFAEKKGYSKFGSYTGNGNADGTFVYTGFKPAWVLAKNTTSGHNWWIADNKRDTFNVMAKLLRADTSGAETSGTVIDFLSNGFKLRESGGDRNESGSKIIYMSFAENPFVTSTGVPATAR